MDRVTVVAEVFPRLSQPLSYDLAMPSLRLLSNLSEEIRCFFSPFHKLATHAIAYEVIESIQVTAITLTDTRDSSDGSSVSEKYSLQSTILPGGQETCYTQDIAGHPLSSPASTSPSYAPPPFSSLNFSQEDSANRIKLSVAEPNLHPPPPFAPAYPDELQQPAASDLDGTTKAGLADTKEGESSAKSAEEKEPPPPYTEGSSPLGSFTYVMAAAGGPASIITQVPQGGPPPPGGHTFAGMDWHCDVQYDPASLQYMLDFFRTVAQTIPSSSPSPTTDTPSTDTNMQGSAKDMLQDRAGIIVLREDLDFYAIPPKAEIDQSEMIEVKRAAGRALLKQDGIFSGLRKSEEAGTTEQHLIEMLTAGYVVSRFALFRALLRNSRNVLPYEPSNNFRKHVKDIFRTKVKTQNHAAICAALSAGYETLDDLTNRKLRILRQLAGLSSLERSAQDNPDKRRATDGRTEIKVLQQRPRPFDTGRRSLHPNAKRVLDGLPPPPPGHRRRVPTMINANHIPFLRFKKPQSPFLSHMIRKKTYEREKRIARTQRLENLLPLAEDEDGWDDIVRKMHGISSNDNGTSWASAIREALSHAKKVHKANTIKRMHTAQKMFDIMERERQSADQEKLERRNERHQAAGSH
ncbi:MAG: hypothetical protein Q9209_003371 [Squamulea sp. 1 TL-2023]